MFGNLADMSKVHSKYKAYLAQIVVDKTEGIRAKNLIVTSLKVQEAQEHLAKKRVKTCQRINSVSTTNRVLLVLLSSKNLDSNKCSP